MSSVGSTHWCYQCNKAIRPQVQDLICPHCDGGFIQELHEFVGAQSGNASGFRPMEPSIDPADRIIDAFAALMRQRLAGGVPNFDVRTRPGIVPPGPPLIFQGQLPVNVPDQDPLEFLFNGGGLGQRRSDLSDFLGGAGLQELIEQLSRNERRGPPPAPRPAIDAMPTIRISQRHLNADAHCPVCKDKFDLGSEARQMPCDHFYHSDCIVPWLIEHNSCPVCRFELPPSCNSASSHPNVDGRTGNPSSSRRDNNNQNQGRWNPFSFLWPFNQ